MLDFVKNITPFWYFNKKVKNIPYFVDFTLCGAKIQENFNVYESYSNETAKKIDIAYQLWQQGYITVDKSEELKWENDDVSLIDRYIFINRFYRKYWSVIVLFFRLLEFNNPLKEISCFVRTRKIKKVQLNYHFDYNIYNGTENVINGNPLVSIIIPTLNRYQYLNDVLKDIEKQTYTNFEVIVFDQSEPFNEKFYQNWNFDLKVVNQKEKALWLARNSAIKISKGDYILLYDDDSLVDESWIENHLNCIHYFNCEISSGVSISVIGGEVPKHYAYFRWSDQIDTGNVMLKRVVFEKIGLFDRQFEGQRMGDGEFGLRAYLGGFKNISNPLAKRIHLKVSDGGLRQMGSWDAWRPKNFFAPRPIPSVLYLVRKYFNDNTAFKEIIISVFPSIIPYRFKRNKNMLIVGLFIGIILSPILIISVMRSWRLASIKLNQGEIIEIL
jgi:glycosyltransferase involved in cell wall biosynthesis